MDPRTRLQMQFWTGFTKHVREAHPELTPQVPRPEREQRFHGGRHGTRITPQIKNDGLKVVLWLMDEDRWDVFDRLAADERAIQKEIGARLTWEKRPAGRQSLVMVERRAHLLDESSWPECYEWLGRYVSAFSRAFGTRFSAMP